jgi:hypothetical protein
MKIYHSKSNEQEVKQAIQKVREFTKNEKVLVGMQSLLSAIPYAGGPLSCILSEYRSRRNAERVFDAMIELKKAIDGLSDKDRNILSKDEVVEIIHGTLEEISKTTNEEKLRYLRNSMIKAFTEKEVVYSQKQFFLSILRDLTLGEIELIREIYLCSDPFIQIIPLTTSNISKFSSYEAYIPTKYEIRYEESAISQTLKKVLKQRLNHFSEGVLEGLIDSLDAKGLSRIRPNLEKNTVKIMTEVYYDPRIVSISTAENYMIYDKQPKETPIEASQTQFGKDFIKYIES